MNKKSFFLGVVAGIVLSVVILVAIGLFSNKATGNDPAGDEPAINDPIEYLENPVNYEGKSETSFKVFQVLGDAALAKEKEEGSYFSDPYTGKVVLILGEGFYSEQVITVRNPQRVGTYSYTTKDNRPLTVPVVDGDMN